VDDRLDSALIYPVSRGMLLLGAVFTNEYAIEGAAFCNPSMVAHPEQDRNPVGQPAILDDVRASGGRAPFVDRFGRRSSTEQEGRHDRRPAPFAKRRNSRGRRLLNGAVMRSETWPVAGGPAKAADYVLDGRHRSPAPTSTNKPTASDQPRPALAMRPRRFRDRDPSLTDLRHRIAGTTA